jgi:hypothetical protein
MAMKKAFDIVVTQEYESKGEKKKRYINIGSAFDGDKGMSIKIESIPLGWNGWASLYVPKPRESNETRHNENAPVDGIDSDVPFMEPCRHYNLWRVM